MMITTNNRMFHRKSLVWVPHVSFLPPIHTLWFTNISFEYMSRINNFSYKLIDFSKYDTEENKLATYIHDWLFAKNLSYTRKTVTRKTATRKVKLMRMILRTYPFRKVCNYIFNKFFQEEQTIGMWIWRK